MLSIRGDLDRHPARKDTTPPVSYTYTGERLTQAGNTVATVTYGYDEVGRVNSRTERVDGVDYIHTATYWPSGLDTETYHSGRVITYTPDAIGRVTSVSGQKIVRSLTLDYGGIENNGNLQSQTIEGVGLTGTPSQVYKYDQLNRISTATETTAAGTAWKRGFGYDRYGNSWVLPAPDSSGVEPTQFTPRAATVYNTATNRSTSGLNGAVWDEAGNQSAIGGYTYQYDAENRMKQSTLNGTMVYQYDGEGRRVAKVSCPSGASTCDATTAGATTTQYVYDAQGQLAAEYGSVTAAPPCTTCYVMVDHLGSTRVLTDENGVTKECHDYLPFGEEILAGVGGRTTACYQSAAATGVLFTGKERDSWAENNGLDYFGARYFSGAMGRFTSPDEFPGGIVDPFTGQQISQPGPLPYADITNPQSLNKYAYVLNNPLRYVDPDGHAEHEGALSLVQDWFDVIEIKGSVGLGVGVGGQAGAAQYKLEYTLVGGEGKIGLGGGGGEMKGLTGFKAAGQVGTVGGQVTVGAQVSTKDGATAEGSVQVNAGDASAKLGVKANSAGVTPISNATVKADVKIGAEVKAVAGVGVSVNLSQAARASQNTAQAARTTWQVLKSFVANKVKELQGTAQGAQ